MTRLLLALLALALLQMRSHACLNSYTPNERARQVGDDALKSITEAPVTQSWDTVRRELTNKLGSSRDVETLNDLAVAMMHTGAAAESIPLLEEIERTTPGRYQTAANIGTAYELIGRNQEALFWIQKGIEIDPESHEGSEWIHVAILKAKLALEKDPQWLEHHRVLGWDFGSRRQPSDPHVSLTGNQGQFLNNGAVLRGLEHQLHERLQFVRPPDEIVAQLLFDYASLLILENRTHLDAGRPLYQFALPYATTDTSKMAIIRRIPREYPSFWSRRWEWALSMGLLALLLTTSSLEIHRLGKKHIAGEIDPRFTPVPPLVTLLIGAVGAMWLKLTDSALELLAPTGSILVAICIGIALLSSRSEKRLRMQSVDREFDRVRFGVSAIFFATVWTSLSYWLLMR